VVKPPGFVFAIADQELLDDVVDPGFSAVSTS